LEMPRISSYVLGHMPLTPINNIFQKRIIFQLS